MKNLLPICNSLKLSVHSFFNCETQLLTDQELSSTIFPCCCSCVHSSRRGDISTYLHYMMFQTIQTVYFLKALGPRISKLILQSVGYTNTQIQIHKQTNTAMTKCQKDPACGIFLKRGLFKDIKNYITKCLIHKYTNTNTQIHKYSKLTVP